MGTLFYAGIDSWNGTSCVGVRIKLIAKLHCCFARNAAIPTIANLKEASSVSGHVVVLMSQFQ